VGNSFLAEAHKSFIHKMDFSFPKILFIINIRGINVHLYGSHLFLFLSLVYRKCFIHQTDLSSMSACLSITLSCGKMFYPRNPNYHPRELFSFIWGCGNVIIHETDLSSKRAFFLLLGDCGNFFIHKTDLSSTRACFSLPLGYGNLE